jgi:hypothetical protein
MSAVWPEAIIIVISPFNALMGDQIEMLKLTWVSTFLRFLAGKYLLEAPNRANGDMYCIVYASQYYGKKKSFI